MSIPRRFTMVALIPGLLLGCGGGSNSGTNTPPPPPPPPALALAKGTPSGDGQTGIVSQALSAVLRVRATRGSAAAPNEPVTWTTTSGQITGSGATGADGTATATWVLGATTGAKTATATSGAVSVQFSATAVAQPGGGFQLNYGTPSGNAQTATVGTQLPVALKVSATNNGAPASGALVIWSTTAANGFFDPPQSTTAADGTASTLWTLGTIVGTQNAAATVGSASLPFTATATAGQGGGLVEIHLTTSGGARFVPANVQVAVGTTVRWIWDDGPHTVSPSTIGTFTGNPTAENPPKTYEFTFTQAGTYAFYCDVHGTRTSGMRGTVVVQ